MGLVIVFTINLEFNTEFRRSLTGEYNFFRRTLQNTERKTTFV